MKGERSASGARGRVQRIRCRVRIDAYPYLIRSMRFLVLLLPFLLACDSGRDGDEFFESDLLSVYAFTATGNAGVTTQGTIGLTLIPSDAGGLPDVWTGRWDLDARGESDPMFGRVEGRGSIRGETVVDAASGDAVVELTLYADLPREGAPQEAIGYELRIPLDPPLDEGVLTGRAGTWASFGGFTGGVVETGTFEIDLTRRATEFIIAG